MKKKKALIITSIAVVCLAGAGLAIVPRLVSAKTGEATVSATQLRTGELSNYISLTGTVQSSSSVKVYPELNEKVTNIYVAVGDVVEAGQLLCELDTTDIETSIDEQKSSMSLSAQNSYNQIKESERTYNDAVSNLKNSANSQLNNAETSLKNAETELNSRQKTYDELLEEYNSNSSSKLTAAEKSVTAAKKELDTKIQAYEESQELFAVDAISRSELDGAKNALDTAQDNYDDAVDALADTQKTLADELEAAKDALDSAQATYDNAKLSLNATNISIEQELAKYQSNIESAKLSANNDSQVFALSKLERQLEQSKIYAPMAGTVTAVYATVGESASGLLFVIEDTGALKIATSIKEYDLDKIDLGLPARIESDATGDEVYDGELIFVSPTSEKDSNGETISSTDVDFPAEISVASGTKLRIGSNARIDLIYEREDNVMYLPVEAVTTDMRGTSYIYALTPVGGSAAGGERPEMSGERPEMPEGGESPRGQSAPREAMNSDMQYTVRRIEVVTGLETDLYIGVTGDGLQNGMMVVNNPGFVNDGDIVKIGLNNSGFTGAAGGRTTGGMGGMGGGMRIGGF